MRYLIDVYTKADQRIVDYTIQPPRDFNDKDEIGRYEWQLANSDSDVLLSDVVGFAVYHPAMESMEKYKDKEGIATFYGDKENVVHKIKEFLLKMDSKKEKIAYAGWNIKKYIVPNLYKAFIINGISKDILDRSFDLYPFDHENTIDLSNVYNFNGQQQTVRARNFYSLGEVCFAYGYGGDYSLELAYRENDVGRILIEKIKMSRFLFNKWGLKWKR